MKTSTAKDGQCLCGATRVAPAKPGSQVSACHCGMCRRWGGGPALAIDCGVDVSVEGENHIEVFDSSAWAVRGFCRRCGTHLFYRIKASGQYVLPAGLFQVEADLSFDHQIFIDRKPDYYEFANVTENLTEAQVFAKYAPPTTDEEPPA